MWPRLFDIPFAEHVATMMLQSRAGRRVSADQALRHRYFSDLPSSLHSLHPQVGESKIINKARQLSWGYYNELDLCIYTYELGMIAFV